MADFCKQCSIETFGEDFEDMKGLVTEAEYGEGYLACVLCEGCGSIQVNPEGECVSKDCLELGHKK